MRCSDTPWLERQAQEKCTTHFTKRLVSQVSIRFRPVDLANFHLEFVHPEYIEYRELKYDKEKGMYVCRMTSVRIHSTPWLLLNIETPEKNPNNSMANKHRVTDRAIINLRKKKRVHTLTLKVNAILGLEMWLIISYMLYHNMKKHNIVFTNTSEHHSAEAVRRSELTDIFFVCRFVTMDTKS